jgi:sugar (pentulose or hexulose) kinase
MPISSDNSQIKDTQPDLPSPPERGTRGEAVIAIFDIGKTNKKLFLFNRDYKIVYEQSNPFAETTDEDGFPCENIENLRSFVLDALNEVSKKKEVDIKAVNFSTYGASFVYLDEEGKPVAPLYNYLKPYPQYLQKKFYHKYGGEEEFSYRTASPALGSLNSGMQLYRIKYEKPDIFKQIKYALHLPQYLSYLLTGKFYSDITSIGCHTNLWDFQKNDYHEWVYKEGIAEKLPPIVSATEVFPAVLRNANYHVGVGLHDSSAALIPYLVCFKEPFVLISTGTWCISLNPFNQTPLTAKELQQDCLSYLQYNGMPVKASRLFAGNEHEEQVKKIADHFSQHIDCYRTVKFDAEKIKALKKKVAPADVSDTKEIISKSLFAKRNLSQFVSYEEAYHQLIQDIVTQQQASTKLILQGAAVKQIFVDGGFSKNPVYMNLLAEAFPDFEVFAASMAQATSVGTALAIHNAWNDKQLPNNIIELKKYDYNHS